MAMAMKHAQITVQLDLSEDEIDALMAVLWHVGGDPDDTPRRYINSILAGLREAGFDPNSARANKHLDNMAALRFGRKVTD